jgi:hypothetical protein
MYIVHRRYVIYLYNISCMKVEIMFYTVCDACIIISCHDVIIAKLGIVVLIVKFKVRKIVAIHLLCPSLLIKLYKIN